MCILNKCTCMYYVLYFKIVNARAHAHMGLDNETKTLGFRPQSFISMVLGLLLQPI